MIEKVYQEYWKDIIEKDGKINIERVKKELFDYHTIINNVPVVYDYITGSKISPLTDSSTVLALVENYNNQCTEDYVYEEIRNRLDQNLTLSEVLDELEEWRDFGRSLQRQDKRPHIREEINRILNDRQEDDL